MGKNSDPITGWKYSFGIHMGLGRGPVNSIVAIKVGDKMAWQGEQTESGSFQIDKPDLFGGDNQEGGIKGTFEVMMGEPTQTAVASLVAMLGHALPGFRRMVTAFYNGQIASNSPYPKAWKFRVRRSTKGWMNDECWYPEKAMILLDGDPVTTTVKHQHVEQIPAHRWQYQTVTDSVTTTVTYPPIHAMNPAHIIYECLTNREWGRGLPASSINTASFTVAADTLADEGFGLCLKWSRRDSLDSFVQSVIDHIGAAIYSDRETSLMTIKLIRKDYDVATLPVYTTDSGILEIRENAASSLGPAVNEVVVSYTDPISNEERTVNAQNLASLQATRGVFNSVKKAYSGLPTAVLARRVAQRELRLNAMSLRQFTITFDRRAWRIPPAGVFRIQDPVRGIGDVVVRAGKIEDGTLTNGTITITAVQDVFGLPSASFIGNQPPNPVKPDNAPILLNHRAFEVPYFILAGSMSPADFAYVADDAGFIGTVVEKPSDLSLAYNLYVKDGAPTPDEFPPENP
jgi:hypothetical protein